MNHQKYLAVSPFTMPAALAAADELLGGVPSWSGDQGAPEQRAWLVAFRRRSQVAAGISEIHSHATVIAEHHAAWLHAQGWDAQITQGGPHDILLAATLNIVAKWREAGHAYQQGGVDRVGLKKGAYTTSTPENGQRPVVEVATQHPSFTFCFQQVDDAPPSITELLARALDMVSRSASEEVHFDFPMVDLRVHDNAGYMLGLHSGLNMVTQAAEQLRLELNEVGGRASAAAEVAVTRSSHRTVKIDGPFIVAVNRNGAPKDGDKVVFAAYCDRSAWRKPADGRI